MDYISLIENRKSARGFMDTPVTSAQFQAMKNYYDKECKRLCPDIATECIMMDGGVKADLELVQAAGYEKNLIGAPAYFIILTEDKPGAIANASYMAEDMVLKAMELGMGSCFLTFADGDRIKHILEIESDMQVAVMVAFGNEARLAKKMRFNPFTMGKIGLKEKRGYYDPKKKVEDIVYIGTHGNTAGMDEAIGFYDNILGEALYAASLSPSYLNRQPYEFIINGGEVVLVGTPDEFTDPVSEQQNIGVVMLHFEMAAAQLIGSDVTWNYDVDAAALALPEGYKAIASMVL